MKVGWECFWLGNVEKVDVKGLGELKKKKVFNFDWLNEIIC